MPNKETNYLEAPDRLPVARIAVQGLHTVFLAGGISGTENWQRNIAKRFLKESDLFVINPRREEGLMTTGDEASLQIEWEFKALRQSTFVMFWFPSQTVCPIALLELGTFLARGRNESFSTLCRPTEGSSWPYVYAGCHPDYSRRFDLEQQTKLYDPRIKIKYDLDELASVMIEDSKRLGEE